MSAFSLKLIALITMIVDHVGAIFFPDLFWLRCIGRLSMPIYAFLLVQGYFHTRNYSWYLVRIGILALVSEMPYDYLFHGSYPWPEYENQNILFTLFTGLLILKLLDLSAKKKNIFLFLAAVLLCAVPYVLHFDYGIYGIAAILSFFLFRKYRGIDCIAYGLASYGYCLSRGSDLQLWSLAAVPLLLLYNGKRGKFKLKYVFYLCYPVHLWILFGIRLLLQNPLLLFP